MQVRRRLSVVVQGPVTRRSDGGDRRCIEDVLASLRLVFPDAQLILSTWQGTDTSGLDADVIVRSEDPGPIIYGHPMINPSNVNRMTKSVLGGLAVASESFCIKTRTDALFTSSAIADLPQHVPGNGFPLESRIHITSLGTKSVATTLMPLHFSDLIHFGTTRDLIRLWSNKPCRWDEIYHTRITRDGPLRYMRMGPEQALYSGFLRRCGIEVTLDDVITRDEGLVATSINALCAGFDLFDERALGIALPGRMRRAMPPVQLIAPETLDTLRECWTRDARETLDRVMQKVRGTWDTLNIKEWQASEAAA